MKKTITISVDVDVFEQFRGQFANVSDTINNLMTNAVGNAPNRVADLQATLEMFKKIEGKTKEKGKLGLCDDEIGFIRNRRTTTNIMDRISFNEMRVFREKEEVSKREYERLCHAVWNLYGKKFKEEDTNVLEEEEDTQQDGREVEIDNVGHE